MCERDNWHLRLLRFCHSYLRLLKGEFQHLFCFLHSPWFNFGFLPLCGTSMFSKPFQCFLFNLNICAGWVLTLIRSCHCVLGFLYWWSELTRIYITAQGGDGGRKEQCRNLKHTCVFFKGGWNMHYRPLVESVGWIFSTIICWLCKSYIFSNLHFDQLISGLYITDTYIAESKERLHFWNSSGNPKVSFWFPWHICCWHDLIMYH